MQETSTTHQHLAKPFHKIKSRNPALKAARENIAMSQAETPRYDAIIVQDGIHQLTRAGYDQIDAVNQSTLIEILRSPKRYRYRLANPQPQTDSMAFGSMVHCLALEPDAFAQRFAVGEETRRSTIKGKAFHQAAAEAGKQAVTKEQFDIATKMTENFRAHRALQPYLKGAAYEVTALWSSMGVRCKGMMDLLHVDQGAIVDLKTTTSADRRAFTHSAVSYGYFFQAGFYMLACEALKLPVTQYLIAAVEKDPPYDLIVYKLSNQALGYGKLLALRALEELILAKAFDAWVGYPQVIETLDVPNYLLEEIG